MNQRLKSMAAVMLAAMMTVTTNAQVTAPDWENPAVLGINKLPYHATLQLPSKEKACQEIISLDGEWLFHWSKNPDERPVSFYEMNYDVSQWGKITVPGNWQTQGYGIPIYINCIRAWDYGEEDLGVRHPNELPRGRFVNLNIDLDIHGVGGADTWGKRTLAPYTIDGNQSHHYSFILNP